ncbi:hypothetical protein HER10_EVM0012796 [Colletotrichum scovillei]|uniref:uncharacterized protein n=1 Tax=Colletotrichum scovillei TaxID=1209932 RepID=UPI0015C30247|nr:uncharacterized protein HER10_EVM0012796 [Colletotrichum scovillei]KAF4783698.1 hypothetical protein HER10_EVM0012796 [Colletotrichum scovillei]
MQNPPARLQAWSPRQKKPTTFHSRFPRFGFLLFFFGPVFLFGLRGFLRDTPIGITLDRKIPTAAHFAFFSFPWAWVLVLRMIHDNHFTTNDEYSRLRAQRYESRRRCSRLDATTYDFLGFLRFAQAIEFQLQQKACKPDRIQ